jgi:hypothetical protein
LKEAILDFVLECFLTFAKQFGLAAERSNVYSQQRQASPAGFSARRKSKRDACAPVRPSNYAATLRAGTPDWSASVSLALRIGAPSESSGLSKGDRPTLEVSAALSAFLVHKILGFAGKKRITICDRALEI